ncbi:peptidoglycan DD-metalloendopeptidase family protein [Pedobacter sp. BS3]|uniref:murein hydrolase activator EnvC family protein n=1 Tax=Pedobacter sp. BS3 TaxID=2567937 RepID=UPI0011F02F36|nr:peptidoglycan DD-metalloendopeptidase family protein [Pedobacter sp. BS3]TZF83195.1 peptidoglycan DD-metalloendopeptidase family protein [Pedobacter sp. BS3]
MSLVRGLLFFSIILCTVHTFGQSSAELKRRKEALTREINMLNSSLNKTSSSKRLSLKQINVLNAQIRLREQKINTINSEIRLLDNQISDNTNTVHSLQSQLNKLKKEYAGMVLFAFRNQSAYSKLMFIFAAKDFNQAYKRLKYLQQFGEYRQKQAKYIQETQRDLNAKIKELDHHKKEKSGLLSDEENEKQTLGKEKTKQSKVLTSLTRQEKNLRAELSQKQKEAARLNRAIRDAINREIEAAKRKAEEEARAAAARAKAATGTAVPEKPVAKGSSVLAATPEAAKLSSDFLSNRGRLPWPVAVGTIVEDFGNHSYGVNVNTFNNGVDIKTSEGAAVRAVFSGEVSTVQNIGGMYAVLIRHGEYFTVYSNLRSASVSKGQKVSVKQTIGTVLTDSDDGTTQLHFEIRKGAEPMNPQSWLAN